MQMQAMQPTSHLSLTHILPLLDYHLKIWYYLSTVWFIIFSASPPKFLIPRLSRRFCRVIGWVHFREIVGDEVTVVNLPQPFATPAHASAVHLRHRKHQTHLQFLFFISFIKDSCTIDYHFSLSRMMKKEIISSYMNDNLIDL